MANAVSRLTRNGKSVALLLPRTKMLELGWKRGDHVTCFVEQGRLIVQNMERDIEVHRRAAAELVANATERGAA